MLKLKISNWRIWYLHCDVCVNRCVSSCLCFCVCLCVYVCVFVLRLSILIPLSCPLPWRGEGIACILCMPRVLYWLSNPKACLLEAIQSIQVCSCLGTSKERGERMNHSFLIYICHAQNNIQWHWKAVPHSVNGENNNTFQSNLLQHETWIPKLGPFSSDDIGA